MHIRILLTAVVLLILACGEGIVSREQSPPPRRPGPDESVRLQPELKVQLKARFDVDALEKLLQYMTPDERSPLLNTLQAMVPETSTHRAVVPGASTSNVTLLIKSTDSVKQSLLDEIWAPYWEHLPLSALDDPTLPFPGRELARVRAAKGAKEDKGDERD